MRPAPTHLTTWGSTREGSVPWDWADAVEVWAREQGRHGRLVWNTVLRCYEAQIDLKDADPRLLAWQQGKVRQKPVESVFFHRQDKPGGPWVAMDLQQMGPSGIRKYLDEGNLWSGRGRYRNLMEACRAADDHNQRLEAIMAEAAEQGARDNAREHRRQLFDLPLVSVPANVEKDNGQ